MTNNTYKICPKCHNIHNNSGTFCSRKCANSRQWTNEDKKKKSESIKYFYQTEKGILQKQNTISSHLKYCNNCGKSVIGRRKSCSDHCKHELLSRRW